MNEIIKKPLTSLGYHFIPQAYLPAGKDEYYLRNTQNRSGIKYRNLTAYEIEVLVRNRNTSDNWNHIHVSDAFNPELVKACKFYGLVRIGKLESLSLTFHNFSLPVGLYNSTIISCDFGDNVVISEVAYISHYIIGNEVIISNVAELHATDHAKFGNGILKEGEEESIRIWVEVGNENGGRKILPFNGMLTGDAWLWSKYRDDEALMNCLKSFTEKKFSRQRGYYGKIGDHCIIKNCNIIKDVWIGSNAYIKGANKLKNLTINSAPEAPSQIGEGCEMVNGIIGYGCRSFYGVKAVRFVMASHSQLKYGARLINSFLGNNSTISCCEVLNSLIFPGHEQHHNNSFLIAATIMGQSNIAAGATLGSNHNSRAADGEMLAARGFWPGLCVSIKHNSKFASFTLLAKGDYNTELNIPLPFSLVSNNESANELIIMPAYWFSYNLYALARNAGKYIDRDKRIKKTQHFEYGFLAPDSINEVFTALSLLCRFTAQAYLGEAAQALSEEELVQKGEALLNGDVYNVNLLDIRAYGFENSKRPVKLIKVAEAYRIYKELIVYYGAEQLLLFFIEKAFPHFSSFKEALLPAPERESWLNVGGQLIPEKEVAGLLSGIKSGTVKNWDDIHAFYRSQGSKYGLEKRSHAFAALLEIKAWQPEDFNEQSFETLLQEYIRIKEDMAVKIYDSRAKDYDSSFRKMMYDNDKEMENVIGRLEENVFINQQAIELTQAKELIKNIRAKLFPSLVVKGL